MVLPLFLAESLIAHTLVMPADLKSHQPTPEVEGMHQRMGALHPELQAKGSRPIAGINQQHASAFTPTIKLSNGMTVTMAPPPPREDAKSTRPTKGYGSYKPLTPGM